MTTQIRLRKNSACTTDIPKVSSRAAMAIVVNDASAPSIQKQARSVLVVRAVGVADAVGGEADTGCSKGSGLGPQSRHGPARRVKHPVWPRVLGAD